MNNRYYLVSLLCLGILSCTSLEQDVVESKDQELTFTANMADNPDTKTVLQNDRMSIFWSPRDSIRIFCSTPDGTSSSGMFISTNTEPANYTNFTGSLSVATGTIDNPISDGAFFAVYPNKMAVDSYSSNSVRVLLPAIQMGADNTFARGMFPAAARSNNLNLSFYNICGGIVFTVVGEGIKTVTIAGNGNEPIAGYSDVSFSSGVPNAAPYSDGATSVTLKAPGGKTFTPGVRYFISVYPTVFEQGFKLTFFKASSKTEVTWTKKATIRRSRFLVVENADADAGEYEYAVPEEAYNDMDELYLTFQRNIASQGNAYIYSPFRMLFNMGGDDVFSAGNSYLDVPVQKALNEYWPSSDYTNNDAIRLVYTGFYAVIDQCNRFIAKYQEDLPLILGPAKVLRAYSHMMLAIGWGTPPLVDHVLAEGEMPYNCDKNPGKSLTHEQLLEWCAQECEAAAQILDERISVNDKEGAYRITKGFAQAVAGKAYLFAGKYAKAESVLEEVINSGKYALVPGERYWENFHIEGDGNEEKVFEPNLEYNSNMSSFGSNGYYTLSTWMEAAALNWLSSSFVVPPQKVYTGPNHQGWGHLGVPEWFADEFIANDGHSYRLDATLKHIDDAVFGMEYGPSVTDNGVMVDNLSLDEKKVSSAIGIAIMGLYGQSFWLPFKQLVKSTDFTPMGASSGVRFNNYTIMRYAEVLLLYAEACLRTGDVAKAKNAINQIQQRSGSGKVSTSVDMVILKREKMFELWFEGCRWADLVRWGDTERVERAGQDVTSLFDKVSRSPLNTDIDVVWENGSQENSRFYTTSTPESRNNGILGGYVPGKHNLFPYPDSVIEANPNLVQNPNW